MSSMTSCRHDQIAQSCCAEAVWFRKTSKSAPASSSAWAARADALTSWNSADCKVSRSMRSVCRVGLSTWGERRSGQAQRLAAGEPGEGFVDVGPSFPADAESFQAVEPGEGVLDHPSVYAQAAAVGCAASGEDGPDPAGPDLVAVDVVVVASVGKDRPGLSAGPPRSAADRRDGVEQRFELSDVVAVAAGEDGRERGAVAVGLPVRDAARVVFQCAVGGGSCRRGRRRSLRAVRRRIRCR